MAEEIKAFAEHLKPYPFPTQNGYGIFILVLFFSTGLSVMLHIFLSTCISRLFVTKMAGSQRELLCSQRVF